ncbi:unnamed protein product [Ceutorhynchus assimilis]|uniref:Peptidase S1 domain-containing protein n=1 Tax=Ceutorhynchus assimilis TaxID=467358 RepID=A0A9N9MUA9_9CUCU|nr:unnamed protein product [Ceutorhynchus assimilis]
MRCLLVIIATIFALASAEGKSSFTYPSETTNTNSLVRIVGGQQASPNQFPYQVALYIKYKMTEIFCGGSLVSANYVLTAAHCAEGAISIDIILGAYNVSDTSENTQQHQTSTTYKVHPEWDSSALINDLALIKLSTPAKINSSVQIIALPKGNDSYAGSTGVITGWGKTTDAQNTVTDILRYATNNIYSNSECKSVDSDYSGIIKNTHLCLSGEGQTSICKGDSGGPLVSGSTQIGISSFSYKSCEASKPSVFTRISEFKEWIKNNSDVEI